MHWLRPEATVFGIAELSVGNAHFVPNADIFKGWVAFIVNVAE